MLELILRTIGPDDKQVVRGRIRWDGQQLAVVPGEEFPGCLPSKEQMEELMAEPARYLDHNRQYVTVDAKDDPEGWIRAMPKSYGGSTTWLELREVPQ